MGYIYKTVNLIDNKSYVGLSTHSSEDTKKYLGSGVALRRAVRKYGKNNFKKEILVEGDFNQNLLNELERHYIRLYSPPESKTSYNINPGGFNVPPHSVINTKKSVYQFDKTKKLLNIFASIKECNQKLKFNANYALKMGGPCKKYGCYYSNKNKFPKDNRKLKGYVPKNKKQTYAKNIHSNVVKIFSSIAEASLKTGIDKNSIARSIANNAPVQNKFVFSNTGNFKNNYTYNNCKFKTVALYNNDEYLIFNSYGDAAEHINEKFNTSYKGCHISEQLRGHCLLEGYNLEKLSGKIRKKRYYNKRDVREVKMFDIKGNLINTYKNTNEAAQANGIKNIGVLQNAIRLGSLCNNHFFTKDDTIKVKYKIVATHVNNKDEILYFYSNKQCAETLEINKSAVTDRCIGRITCPIKNYHIHYNN